MVKENYIQNPLHDPLRPGALGLGQNLATMVVTLFNLLMYITPLVCLGSLLLGAIPFDSDVDGDWSGGGR